MIRSLAAVYVVGVCLVGVRQSVADEEVDESALALAPLADPLPGDDVEDLVLLSPTRPVRIRLHIEVDGVGFRRSWRSAAASGFRRFDSDGKGSLTAAQAAGLVSLFGASTNGQIDFSALPAAMSMKNSESVRVSREEIFAALAKRAPPLVIEHRLSSGGAGPALFPLLDSDGDGRLSREELDAAEESVRCRDFNDDLLITEQELISGPDEELNKLSNESGASSGPVIGATGTPTESLVDALLHRYDRNRDGRLSYEGSLIEIRDADGGFAKLDRDADQTLNRAELSQLVQATPDAEVQLELGRHIAVRHDDRQPAQERASVQIRRKLDGGYRLSVAQMEIDIRRNNRNPAQADEQPRAADYDTDGDGQLTAKELEAAGRGALLALMDVDRDGKVTVEEFEAYYRWQASLAGARLRLDVSDEGLDLFSRLDQNGDRVLSPRELETAAAILSTDDPNHDGYVTSAEIPYNMTMELVRGGARAAGSARALMPRAAKVIKSSQGGPQWFVKMDRNGDGEISPAEFLGTRSAFERLDGNHDGLIDAEEAGQAAAGN